MSQIFNFKGFKEPIFEFCLKFLARLTGRRGSIQIIFRAGSLY